MHFVLGLISACRGLRVHQCVRPKQQLRRPRLARKCAAPSHPGGVLGILVPHGREGRGFNQCLHHVALQRHR